VRERHGPLSLAAWIVVSGLASVMSGCSRGPTCADVAKAFGPPEAWMTESLAGSPRAVHDRIMTQWSQHTASDGVLHGFVTAARDEQLFPTDSDLAAAAGELNPDLRRYVELSADQRTNDVYLFEPTGDRRWPSEFLVGGQTLPFQTSFILHLAPGDKGTAVTAIEVRPMVLAGQDWRFERHGPGWIFRFCPTPPSVGDRRRLIEIVRTLMS
jgi:hypothetical protein